MIAETISSACFALLVVVFCFVIKIYTMVKSIRPSRNERVRVVYARDNQRALPVEREPTVYFPRAERSAGQHGTFNNTTADHKRDGDSRKRMTSVLGDKVSKKCPVCFSTTRKSFFLSSPPSAFQALCYHLLSFLT